MENEKVYIYNVKKTQKQIVDLKNRPASERQ